MTFSPITPRIDLAFKKIFGVEENKDLLISLVNSIVSENDQVADLTLLNPYNLQNFRDDKLSILDIKAQGRDGKLFNIEIQITDEANYDKRALYYWARVYSNQLLESQRYRDLKKVIGIHILNFLSIPHLPDYHNVFEIVDQKLKKRLFNDFEMHTIELPKFQGADETSTAQLISKIKSALDLWVSFLTKQNLLPIEGLAELPKSLKAVPIQKALHALDVLNFSAEERDLYEDRFRFLLMEEDALFKQREEGREEGIEIGMEKGREKGREEGREEGIEIGLERGKLEIAGILLARGLSLEEISKITGIALEVLEDKLLEPTP